MKKADKASNRFINIIKYGLIAVLAGLITILQYARVPIKMYFKNHPEKTEKFNYAVDEKIGEIMLFKFDYKTSVDDAVEQYKKLAQGFMGMPEEQAECMAKITKKYLLPIGKQIKKEKGLQMSIHKAKGIIHSIAAYSYSASLDLSRFEIPEEYWDEILKKVIESSYELEKQSILAQESIEHTHIVLSQNAVNICVNSTEELYKEGKVSQKSLEKARNY